MSDTGVNKQSNSSCVTADSNFASARTSEKFYKLLLLVLQTDPRTKDLFAAENGKGFKVTAMPIGLRDLGKIDSKHTKHRENYATERAEYEAKDYAEQMCPASNPAYADFYNQRYFKAFKDSVVAKFSAISDRTIKLLSQTSYASLTKRMVNILLKCKPDGTKNIVRRLKINPATQVFDEEGKLISYQYYTDKEIEEEEKRLYAQEGANQLDFLNLEHIPFVFQDFLLSLSSLMNVQRKGRTVSETKLYADDIFPTEGVADPTVAECFTFLSERARSDLQLIDFLESRQNGQFTLADLIHLDYDPTSAPKPRDFYERNLTMREIYVTLLIYLKYITIIAAPLINISRGLVGNEQKSDIAKKIGTEDGDDDNFLVQIEDILTNLSVIDMLNNEEQVLFTIPDYLARYLVYFVAKGFASRKPVVDKVTGESGLVFGVPLSGAESKVFDAAFSALSLSSEASTNTLFKNFFDKTEASEVAKTRSHFMEMVKRNPANEEIPQPEHFATVEENDRRKSSIPKCELYMKNFVSVLVGKSEECVSYLYRTASRYLVNTEEGPRFSPELALIERTVRYIVDGATSSRARTIRPYDISYTKFTFSTDALLDTVRKLTGISIVEGQEPFATYKRLCTAKTVENETMRASIASTIDKMFGQTTQQFYIDLPPIPYDEDEIRWAARKCDDLFVVAESIHSKSSNLEFDWNKFREAYRALKVASTNLAESRYESPELVSEVVRTETEFNALCEACGLDTRDLSSLKETEDSLYFYSNLDKIKFDFKPFLFNFNSNVGLEMYYNITKTEILHGGKMKTIPSVVVLFGGKKIIEDYFRPFFECFSRTNKDSFKVELLINETNFHNNPSLSVALKVTFGCTEDLHECSKFRTFFYSIDDYDQLIEQSRAKLGITPNDPRKLALNEVPATFVIRWNRTTAQNEALSGGEREKTFKFYDDVRGCSEGYPFYDNVGPKIIRDDFKVIYDKYIQWKSRSTGPRPPPRGNGGRKPPGDDSEEFPELVTGRELNERSIAFWKARNGAGEEVNIADVIEKVQSENKVVAVKKNQQKSQSKSRDTPQMSNPFAVFDDDYGKVTMKENQPGETKLPDRRARAQYRMQSKIKEPVKKGEWEEVKYRGKRFKGTKKDSKDRTTPTPNKRNATPHRFQGKGRNRTTDSTERGDRSSRHGTGNRGTPDSRNTPVNRGNNVFVNSRGSTPNTRGTSRGGTPGSEGRYEPYANGTSSPGFANKRAGAGEVANSPSYLQPDRQSVFNRNYSSPSAQQGTSIFNAGAATPDSIPAPTGFLVSAASPKSRTQTHVRVESPRTTTPVVEVVQQKFEANDEEWM